MLFLAMRLIVGDDLATIVRDHGPLDPERAAGIVAQVAGGRAYLTDFGLVTRTSAPARTARSGRGRRHPRLPRSRADPRRPDRSLDRHLRARLCAVLPAHRPRRLPARERRAETRAHVSEPPPRPSTVRPDIPHQLDLVLQRALANDPDARWPTATVLANPVGAGESRYSVRQTLLGNKTRVDSRSERSSLRPSRGHQGGVME